MHNAKNCCEGSIGTRIWHPFYCAWLDHGDAGHRVRAAVYGWIADRLARWA